MTREEKQKVVESLMARLAAHPHFYVVELGGLNAGDTHQLRKMCFERGVELVVVKNTLFAKALEQAGHAGLGEIEPLLCNESAVFFTDVANEPAKIIKEFRKTHEKPVLKAAYAEESVYLGEGSLDALAQLKSRDEIVADIMQLLQSPIKTVVSAVQSGGSVVSGLVKALSERGA